MKRIPRPALGPSLWEAGEPNVNVSKGQKYEFPKTSQPGQECGPLTAQGTFSSIV